VIHTAEGALSFEALGAFFADPDANVSSHTGIDDTPGVVGEYLEASGVAYTAASFNGCAVQTELCAFAAWGAADWAAHDQMLENCALWIAEEAARFGIPIVKLDAAGAQGGGRGVCGHVDLGAAGGGHTDPGPAFPWGPVLELATGGGDMVPYPPTLSAAMIATADVPGGYYMAGADGGVFTFGAATFYGSLGGVALSADIVAMMAVPDGSGYYLIGADGGVFTFGSAVYYGGLGNVALEYPITAADLSDTGRGYRLTASDGGVFTFGDAFFYGSVPAPA
jgi:hypothetical protein